MSFSGKPNLTSDAPLGNDGFWPELAIGDLVGKYRIPSNIDDGVINTALVLAMINVNQELQAVKAEIMAIPFLSFDDYLANNSIPQGDDELLLILYQHAVFSKAKASLLQQFPAMSTKSTVDQYSQDLMAVTHWIEESQFSITTIISHIIPTA